MDNRSYIEKLRDPRWQKKKAEILIRDKYKCRNCGNTEMNLQVHHLEYLGGLDPYEYPDDMLITLCEDCHGKEKDRGVLEKNLATTLKMRGFLYDDLVALSSILDTMPDFTSYILTFIRKFKHGKKGNILL